MVLRIDRDSFFKWLFGTLIAVELGTVVLDALISEFEWIPIGAAQRLFNITREDSFANFFSSVQMLAVATVVLLIALVVRDQMRESASRVPAGWGVLTGIFFFIGLDDGVKLHERLGSIFSYLVTDSYGEADPSLFGQIYDVFPSYSWQLAVGPVFAVMGLFTVIFLIRHLSSTRLTTLAMIAIGLFVVAEGLDFLEGMDSAIIDRSATLFDITQERATHFSKSIEEFFEMLGTTLLLYVFLNKLVNLTRSITFELAGPAATAQRSGP